MENEEIGAVDFASMTTEPRESIKLMKSVKGVYSWELKVLPLLDKLNLEDITRLTILNDQLKEKFKNEINI